VFWAIESFPECTRHVFLSHSAEDRDGLVLPVFEGLKRSGYLPWLDRHDYPYGRGSRVALRDGILLSRHVVFFVTPAMLKQPRGWCVQELAWAELLQDNLLRSGGPLTNLILPLYLVEQSDPSLPRSVWQLGRDRGLFRPKGATKVRWAVHQIVAFLERELLFAHHMAELTLDSPTLAGELRRRPGLVRRVTRFDPTPIPTPLGERR